MDLLQETDHRPWPLPDRPWTLSMRWSKLAFLHWAFEPERVAALLPPGLDVDVHEGRAWVGVVPFLMSRVKPRLTPGLPGHGTFPEINLRTYVTHGHKPGVWFFSLDVPRRLVVWGARVGFHLPYNRAEMRIKTEEDRVDYASRRVQGDAPPAEFAARYRGVGDAVGAEPGSLEAWLAERYCLYSADKRGRLYHGDIHHRPWQLQAAQVELETQQFFGQLGWEEPREAPLAHYAEALDTVAWSLRPV